MGRLGSVLAALILLAIPSSAAAETVDVVAQGLANPRGLDVAGSVLHVAEAGRGGSECGAIDGATRCVGPTGSLVRVDLETGLRARAATGLPSLAPPDGVGATGPADVSLRGGAQALVLGLGLDTAQRASLSRPAQRLGWLYRIRVDGSLCPRIDLAAAAAPGTPSDPLSVETFGGRRAVVDAGARTLLGLDPFGTLETLARLSSSAAPTSVVRGPDGAYYLGESKAGGGGRVVRVPYDGGTPAVLVDGLPAVVDLAWESDGSLYVLGLADAEGPPATRPGILLRIARDGARTELAPGRLVAPGGLATGPDGRVFVSHRSLSPAAGEVLAVRPDAGEPVVLADFEYRGRRVRVLDRGDRVELVVNRTTLSQGVFSRVGSGYASQLLPFEDFMDPGDLARTLIDGDGTLWDLCPAGGC